MFDITIKLKIFRLLQFFTLSNFLKRKGQEKFLEIDSPSIKWSCGFRGNSSTINYISNKKKVNVVRLDGSCDVL